MAVASRTSASSVLAGPAALGPLVVDFVPVTESVAESVAVPGPVPDFAGLVDPAIDSVALSESPLSGSEHHRHLASLRSFVASMPAPRRRRHPARRHHRRHYCYCHPRRASFSHPSMFDSSSRCPSGWLSCDSSPSLDLRLFSVSSWCS